MLSRSHLWREYILVYRYTQGISEASFSHKNCLWIWRYNSETEYILVWPALYLVIPYTPFRASDMCGIRLLNIVTASESSWVVSWSAAICSPRRLRGIRISWSHFWMWVRYFAEGELQVIAYWFIGIIPPAWFVFRLGGLFPPLAISTHIVRGIPKHPGKEWNARFARLRKVIPINLDRVWAKVSPGKSTTNALTEVGSHVSKHAGIGSKEAEVFLWKSANYGLLRYRSMSWTHDL